MPHLKTSIEISASPGQVWSILTNLAAYPAWNPFIRSIAGDLSVGHALQVTVQPVGGREMSFKPRVLVAKPEQELRWKAQILFTGLFDGEHYIQLGRTTGGTTLFTQGELFTGVLVPLIFRTAMQSGTRAGFEAMNLALKQRAERRP